MNEQWLQQHDLPFTEKRLYLRACERKDLKKYFWLSNSELLQNCTEKQIMLFKTAASWLFNDVWCYLVIGCFDLKIGIFQQTVLRVYYMLKCKNGHNNKKMWRLWSEIQRLGVLSCIKDDLRDYKCLCWNINCQEKFDENLKKIFANAYIFCNHDINKWLQLDLNPQPLSS